MTRRGSWEQFHTFIRWNQAPTLPSRAPAESGATVPVVIPPPRTWSARRKQLRGEQPQGLGPVPRP